jgi:hypothetical protein
MTSVARLQAWDDSSGAMRVRQPPQQLRAVHAREARPYSSSLPAVCPAKAFLDCFQQVREGQALAEEMKRGLKTSRFDSRGMGT